MGVVAVAWGTSSGARSAGVAVGDVVAVSAAAVAVAWATSWAVHSVADAVADVVAVSVAGSRWVVG